MREGASWEVMSSSLQMITDAPANTLLSPSGQTLNQNCPTKLL